ncbi:ABC transporter substrate-binding protein [Microbacterium sp. AK031]|uniref:ABC transporter substrate-binding protein n=1 Tax=Microbacterium sp. AK031 TaxID=2723076 RepID=UPI0021690741|nr:ABC transporter substrate-binding protein [Microbacterium sp. AK031]MCS3843648.1 ABC-type glycerol-3-phosphate transport system substrate-binding protein [Microbacterium sp. AK031]
MSRRQGRYTAIIALTAVAAFATGCSSQASDQSTSESGHVDWWGWTPTQSEVAQGYIDAFNEEYPDIEVVFRQVPINGYDAALRPALTSPEGPDVFDIAPGGGIGSLSTFGSSAEDLTPVAEEWLGDDWESKIAANGPAGFTTEDGTLSALSVGSTFAGTLWINQDLFDEYGLSAPTTLDAWIEACAVFRENGHGCLTHGAGQVAFNQDVLQSISDSVEPGWWSAASRGEREWTDDVFVQTLETWKSLFDEQIIDDGALGIQQYPDANNVFLSQQSPMVMMGTWYMPNATTALATASISAAGVADATPFRMIPIDFPDVAGEGNPSVLFGDANYGLAVNANSDAKEAARTFVGWLTTQADGQQVVADAINDIPSLTGVEPAWDNLDLVDAELQQPILQDLIASTATADEPRLSLISAEMQEAIGVASTTVAEGRATPEEAAATMQEAVDALG